jgi:hypothetical protein
MEFLHAEFFNIDLHERIASPQSVQRYEILPLKTELLIVQNSILKSTPWHQANDAPTVNRLNINHITTLKLLVSLSPIC